MAAEELRASPRRQEKQARWPFRGTPFQPPFLCDNLSLFCCCLVLRFAGGDFGTIPDTEGEERPRHGQGTDVALEEESVLHFFLRCPCPCACPLLLLSPFLPPCATPFRSVASLFPSSLLVVAVRFGSSAKIIWYAFVILSQDAALHLTAVLLCVHRRIGWGTWRSRRRRSRRWPDGTPARPECETSPSS